MAGTIDDGNRWQYTSTAMDKEKRKLTAAIIVALLLSFCGGYVEFWSVSRHGIFSGMETGNLITGVISWTEGDNNEMAYRFLAVALFFLVSLICEVIRRLLEKKNLREDVLMLALSAAALAPSVFIEPSGVVPAFFLTVFCALQYSCFRSVKGLPYSTTMMTNLMTNFAKSIAGAFFERDRKSIFKVLEYFLIVAIFIGGVLTSHAFVVQDYFDSYFLLIPLVLTLVCIPLDLYAYGHKVK